MFKSLSLLSICFVIVMSLTAAQDDFPDAAIVNDEGGPVVISGEVTYTNPFFTDGVAAPIIILEDQAGFIDRNRYFIFPPESQTLGQITTDFYTSPFSYSLALPIEPQGSLRDVDNDGEEDAGVMVFAVAYWNNTWGDPFLEVRDLSGGGWSTAYASTRVSENPELDNEIVGGSFVVYAPDDAQGFPSGFGADGLLFTEDDPIVRLPRGYTVVNMDAEPFTFDRSARQTIDLIEPEGAALVDYSGLTYSEAFDSMLDKFRTEYAFTEYKNLDWEALAAEYRPLFVKAEEKGDTRLYRHALREFLWEIPDGHVSFGPLGPLFEDFSFDVARGIGMNIRTTDDGRVLATFILPGGPADDAGIDVGAEIVEINGVDINTYIESVAPWDQPFSTPHNLRLAQERFVVRFDADTTFVDVTFRNPDTRRPTTSSLVTSDEVETFTESNPVTLNGFELPVEYDLLDNGYGYAAIYGFSDNSVLTIQLWERMIQQMNANNIPALIIDMRQNEGGNGFLADQMTAYFFDDELIVGQRGFFNEERGEFYFDERGVQQLYLPPEELRYDGEVAVLIGPSCASACERFAYNLTLENRADIVGMYPTAGLGGSVNDFRMPDGITVRFTVGRSVNPDGEIHIEGKGVAPTIRVPVTEETLFSTGDPILEYAIQALETVRDVPSASIGGAG